MRGLIRYVFPTIETSGFNLCFYPLFTSVADNLLEDLQASVSRPGSSLGQPLAGGYSNTTREVQYLQPANVTTVARERSVSPSFQTVSSRMVTEAVKGYAIHAFHSVLKSEKVS